MSNTPTSHGATPSQPPADLSASSSAGISSSSPEAPLDAASCLLRAQQTLASVAATLAPITAEFARRGHSLYLVGGSVRDALLGRLSSDLDFTTDARPDVITEVLSATCDKIWYTGIDFGTVSAARQGQMIEITTFRADQYDGQSRNPQVTFGDTLQGDLVRRDFRINAMAVKLRADADPEFCDPLGGLDDLVAGTIDTPDDPQISFHDDPLRILRACRFASQLGFDVAPRVVTAMNEMAEQIQRITVERVRVELDKMILGSDPTKGFDLMVDTGVAQLILPEIPRMQMTQDEHMQHKDVYAHSLQVMRQAIDLETDGPDLVLRWAALLHDCGKPDTRKPKPGGGVTFYHHDVVGAKLVRKRFKQLKYSKQVIADVSELVYLHQRFHGYGDQPWTDSAVRRYVTDAGPLLEKLHCLVRADCTTRNQRKARKLQRMYDELERRIAEIAEKEDLAKVRPDLDGNEIMEILDIPAGPQVGKAWSHLKEVRLEQGPLEREDAILELKQWWHQQCEGESDNNSDQANHDDGADCSDGASPSSPSNPSSPSSQSGQSAEASESTDATKKDSE